MKLFLKIFCAGLIAVMLMTAIPCNAAGKACFSIDYTNKKSKAIDLICESGDVNYWVKNKALHVETVSSSGDGKCSSYLVFNVDIPDASQAQWLLICLRNNSDAPKLRFGFGENEITGASASLIDISSKDSKYKTYIVNMRTINEETLPLSSMFGLCEPSVTESVWDGPVKRFRIDLFFTDFPGDDVPEGLKAEIAYIGFFGSEKEAKNANVRPPLTAAGRSKKFVTVAVIALIVILVIAILKYGGSSGNSANGANGKRSGNSGNGANGKKRKGRK